MGEGGGLLLPSTVSHLADSDGLLLDVSGCQRRNVTGRFQVLDGGHLDAAENGSNPGFISTPFDTADSLRGRKEGGRERRRERRREGNLQQRSARRGEKKKKKTLMVFLPPGEPRGGGGGVQR